MIIKLNIVEMIGFESKMLMGGKYAYGLIVELLKLQEFPSELKVTRTKMSPT